MQPRPSRIRLAAALGVVALAAACSGEDGPTAEALLSTIEAAQDEAGSAAVELTLEGGGQVVSSVGAVAFGPDLASTVMEVETDGPGEDQDVSLRLVDGRLFLDLGAATDDRYLDVDLELLEVYRSDPGSPIGRELDLAVSVLDPTALVATLRETAEGVEKVDPGPSSDGVAVTTYEVTVDGPRFLGAIGIADADAPLPGTPDRLTYVLHVGPDDLPRGAALTLPGLSLRTSFSAWGEDVDVQVPPPGEVVAPGDEVGGS